MKSELVNGSDNCSKSQNHVKHILNCVTPAGLYGGNFVQ